MAVGESIKMSWSHHGSPAFSLMCVCFCFPPICILPPVSLPLSVLCVCMWAWFPLRYLDGNAFLLLSLHSLDSAMTVWFSLCEWRSRSWFPTVRVSKVSRHPSHQKNTKPEFDLHANWPANGGRCLNVCVPIEGQGTHLGHFGDKT